MSQQMCGISKRQMRRLVLKEIEKIREPEKNLESSEITLNDQIRGLSNNETCSSRVETFSDNNNVKKQLNSQDIREELKNWCIENRITRKACDDILKILKKAGLDVPESAKSLLETKYNQIETLLVHPGKYFNFGLKKSLEMLNMELRNPLLIDIGIDGLPLYKSSSTQLWPILGCIANNLETKPFLIGAYCGPRKPENINCFLSEFVKEIKELKSTGLFINDSEIDFKINLFICDAPARAFVTGTVGHTCSKGCSKCSQIAVKKSGTLTYATTVSSLRTDEDFMQRKDSSHHIQCFQQNITALEEIGIEMVTQFPLDAMHLIDLGVAKKILSSIWKGSHLRRKLNNNEKALLNSRLLSYKSHIPKDFCRKPRSMEDLCRWKAVEFRQLILYTGIVLFKNILDDDLYVHFLLLHSAYRLVSCPKNCLNNLECVQDMLNTFVQNFQFLYGENKISYNVHNLLHLPDCVRKFGNVDKFSAYKFENYLQLIKKDIRQPTKILEQLNNRINERNNAHKKLNDESGLGKLTKRTINNLPLYKNYRFNAVTLTNATPDDMCYIKPLVAIKILGFVKNANEEEFVIGLKFVQVKDFFSEPLQSSTALGITIVKQLAEKEDIFKVEDILCKVVAVPFESSHVLIPILHHCT